MSGSAKTPRDLAALLLGPAVVRELEARGISPKLELEFDGDSADLDELGSTLETRRAHHDRLATLGELGVGIVHEVRNRVTSMRGFADLARRADLPREAADLVDRIYSLSERCSESLSAFLGFASGAREANEPFDVNRAIGRARILARHQLEIHEVRLEIEVDPTIPMAVGRAEELTQVLVNLALNSQQAMAAGGLVVISSRASNGCVFIDVADNGPGVPVEMRDKIFEPFFTTKDSNHGTGLGLAICARMVDGWDGDLDVDDSDIGGARFTIRLPAIVS